MPSLRIIAILALLAASGVSSAAVPPIRRQSGTGAEILAEIQKLEKTLDVTLGPWLHAHCF